MQGWLVLLAGAQLAGSVGGHTFRQLPSSLNLSKTKGKYFVLQLRFNTKLKINFLIII
jgi:hypothetical protein